MFDEACLVAVETNNRIRELTKKEKDKKKKEDEKFQKDMSKLFENDEGEIR
ncbi:MAG: hypothetical protein ACTTKH_04470 [Treponema sp.]